MNKSLEVIRSAVLAAGLIGMPAAASASVVPLGNVITNGAFGASLTSGWSSSGITSVRLADDAINLRAADDGGGNATFDGFFSGYVAVLGDAAGFISPTDPASESEGTHSLSQSFVLESLLHQGRVLSYRLELYFRTVFDGRESSNGLAIDDWDDYEGSEMPESVAMVSSDSSGTRPSDVFAAHLVGTGGTLVLFSQTSEDLGSCGPAVYPFCDDMQKVIDRSTNGPLTLDDLLPGEYTLSFSLHEASGGGPDDTQNSQTAVGIADVRVVAFARVPEPSSLLLVAAASAGLFAIRARRRHV